MGCHFDVCELREVIARNGQRAKQSHDTQCVPHMTTAALERATSCMTCKKPEGDQRILKKLHR